MPRKFIIAFLITLFALTVTSFAQERSRAEDILRYFPEGTYSDISHDEELSVPEAKAWKLYKTYQDKMRILSPKAESYGELSSIFNKECLSHTKATLFVQRKLSETFKIGDEPVEVTDVHRRIKKKYPRAQSTYVATPLEERKEQMTVVAIVNDGDTFHVYRYEDLDSLIKEALKSGDIERTDELILERPIYTCEGKNTRWGHDQQFFLYATPFNELLAAGRLEHLKQMIAAGEGRMENMLADSRYIDLLDLIPNMPGRWSVRFGVDRFGWRVEQLEAQGLSEQKISKYKEDRKKLELYTASYMEIDDKILQHSVTVYEKEEHAIEAMNRKRPNVRRSPKTPKEFLAWLAMRENKTSMKRDGKRIVKTLTQDEEYLEAQYSYRASMKERQKKATSEKKRND